MRIIGGQYGGRLVPSPKSVDIKPTPDRVRESLFNILAPVLPGRRALDLFSGSGCIGIEMLSRGAEFVLFADKSAESAKAVARTLETFRADSGRYKIMNAAYEYVLRCQKGEKFDIIFLDPPYASDYVEDCIEIIGRIGLLTGGGMIIAEHPDKAELKISPDFAVYDERRYGTIKLSFIGHKN